MGQVIPAYVLKAKRHERENRDAAAINWLINGPFLASAYAFEGACQGYAKALSEIDDALAHYADVALRLGERFAENANHVELPADVE